LCGQVVFARSEARRGRASQASSAPLGSHIQGRNIEFGLLLQIGASAWWQVWELDPLAQVFQEQVSCPAVQSASQHGVGSHV